MLNTLKDTIMKKIFTSLTMMMAFAAMPLFTSCDARFWADVEDRAEARTLEGTWSGYIETYFYDRFGISGDSYRTSMYFERENGFGGWGYEVDYNVNSRYDDYYYCEFSWEVVNGAIRIRYADSWNDVYIYDYVLDERYFSGSMDDGCRDSRIDFNFTYDSRFDWGYWTRGITRGTSDHQSYRASGTFAKKSEDGISRIDE
jgi:hypothetical protein